MMREPCRNLSGPERNCPAGNSSGSPRVAVASIAACSAAVSSWPELGVRLAAAVVPGRVFFFGPAAAAAEAAARLRPAEASPAERMSARRSNVMSGTPWVMSLRRHHARSRLTRLDPARSRWRLTSEAGAHDLERARERHLPIDRIDAVREPLLRRLLPSECGMWIKPAVLGARPADASTSDW